MRAALLLVALAACSAPLPPSDPEMPVGRPLPALILDDDRGAPFSLRALRGPALLVLFRGVTCPYCRTQLASLAHAPFDGVQVVGLCPDPPPQLAALKRDVGVDFPLLFDDGERAVTALCGGRAHCVVLAHDGVVKWGGVAESWAQVPSAEALLRAARSL